MNGITLHGGFIPYGGTFLVFSDYARNAVRLACLMQQRVHPGVHARLHRPGRGWAHTSADRAPEQPARHAAPEPVAALRCGGDRPRLDARDRAPRTHGARAHAPGAAAAAAHRRRSWPTIRRGGYVLIDCSGTPEALVIATGSEIGIAAAGGQYRSTPPGGACAWCPCPPTETFDAQDARLPRGRAAAGRDAPPGGRGGRDAVLVALRRPRRARLGIDRFGASGKGADVFAHFGFTCR